MNAVFQAALPPGSVSQPCTVPAPPMTDFTSGRHASAPARLNWVPVTIRR